MRHPIDPKVDCVFKALLGAEGNRRLLIHFLNAVLGGELLAPITDVELLNPYNEREFLDDKLSVVDVKARDDNRPLYQIEIQLLVVPDLPARILYGWADLVGWIRRVARCSPRDALPDAPHPPNRHCECSARMVDALRLSTLVCSVPRS